MVLGIAVLGYEGRNIIMKVLFIVVALLLGSYLAQISSTKNSGLSALSIAAKHQGKVILYATDWCGYCAKMRRFLKHKKIDYHEYNIEKSVEGKNQYHALGGRGVPLMLVNGQVVRGYNTRQVEKILNTHHYEKSSNYTQNHWIHE